MANPSTEQELLFNLRSPTTPLGEKLQLAASALSLSPSPLLPPLIRDWLLDQLLRSRTNHDTLLSLPLWSLFAQVQRNSPATTASPSLPVFVAFLTAYAALEQPQPELLQAVASTWNKLAQGAMRKATLDAALEAYAALLDSSVVVLQRAGEDAFTWQELAQVWLKSFRAVVDSGKGGKKIPQHTLSQLSALLPLLAIVPSTSALGISLLTTVQFALFNLDNLRRGIARESYNAGVGPAAADDTEGAAGELLGALKAHLSTNPSSTSSVLHSLPLLTSLYFASLAAHSSTLFPLPARTTFPTASAARSAGEIHSLQKRRALAAGWSKGVSALIGWKKDVGEEMEVDGAQEDSEEEKAAALAGILKEVEVGDLHREGRAEGWEEVLESLIEGSLARLSSPTPVAEGTREALLLVLGTILRLSFASTDAYIPRILVVLASTRSSSTSPSPAAGTLLSSLLTHHTRSLTLPTLLLQVSAALADSQATSTPNSLLTSHEFFGGLQHALGGLVGMVSVRGCWEALVKGVVEELPSLAGEVDANGAESGAADEPSVKRRKVASSEGSEEGAAARLRVLSIYTRGLPLPLPQAQFNAFNARFLGPALQGLGKSGKKWKASESGMRGVWREVVGVGYELRERMRGAGNWEGLNDEERASWEVKGKRSEELRALLESAAEGKSEAEVVIAAAQTLLQSLELSTSSPEDAQPILAAVLGLVTDRSVDGSTGWDGHLRGLSFAALPVAAWDLVSRRWLTVVERFASPEQLKLIAELVAESMSADADVAVKEGITMHSITARLLRRADFYELRSLQAQLHPVLLASVTLPSLSPPSAVLEHLAAAKAPKSLRSLPTTSVCSSIATFSRISTLLPIEYLGKALKNELVEKAMGLDVWISAGRVEGCEVEEAQRVLRRFVGRSKGEGQVLPEAPAVLSHLLKNTDSSSAPTVEVTLDLYRHFVSSAVATYKSDKNSEALNAYLAAFDKPLADLSKRFKKGVASLSCEEVAFTALCDVLASTLGAAKDLPADLVSAISASVKSSSKPFAKSLSAVTGVLEADSTSVLDVADLLNACRSLWHVKDWLAAEGEEHDQVDTYSTFAQQILAALLAQITSNSSSAHNARTLRTSLAMLDLLAFRMARLRSISDTLKLSTVPFETFIACHLAFRQALATVAGASAALEANLKRASSSASLREYTAALNGVSATVAAVVANETASLADSSAALEPALAISLVLLRDGPEGSSRLSGACLTDLLRHLSLFALRLSAAKELYGEEVARAYLLLSTFAEGICADRPMLLSRLNVSSVLSLVTRMLQPTSAPSSELPVADEVQPTTPLTSSALFLSLVSIVAHLVRHRKDHISPLFPHLVSTLASFITVLRRSGFGTTGSTTSTAVDSIEGAEIVVSLGRRAEREARATFPFWAWEGGAQGVGKDEAMAVGRLLGSLSTKTTTTLKRKADDTSAATTVSLVAPLSKHAPFIILPYLRACVHATCPIPSSVRKELQGGWFEVMDAMGKWEREALMKGFLGEDEEAERGVLRGMWKSWEKERYRG